MINIRDSSRLALTKLRTRKIRLAVTVVLSCLLFTVLLTASFTVRGTLDSLERLSQSGFGSRYLVQASTTDNYYELLSDGQLIRQAEAQQKTDQVAKTAEAKRLGIPYDAKSDTAYVNEQGGDGSSSKQLNMDVPAVRQLVAARYSQRPGNQAAFLDLVKKYGATATYQSIPLASGLPGGPTATVIKDGKEKFTTSGGQNFQSRGLDTLTTQWQLMNQRLMQPFILPGQSLATTDSIPVVAPFSAAEQALKLQPLSASASAQQRLDRLREVRRRAAGLAIDVCYRNVASQRLVCEAQSQQQEIKQHAKDKTYQPAELVNDLPKTPCGPVAVTRDVRSKDAKQLADKQLQFAQKFGVPAPQAALLHLRIVGLNADLPSADTTASVEGIFSSVLQSSLGPGWITPLEATASSQPLADLFSYKPDAAGINDVYYYAELPSAASVKQLLAHDNCSPQYNASNPYEDCTKSGKYFMLMPFGSSSTGTADIKTFFNKAFLIGAAAVAGFAALIMMGTVGRIIADSRRETAVFRAIGAKRSDIAQIYLTYAGMVGSIIALVSTALAILLAYLVQLHYSAGLTVSALVAFNVADENQMVRLLEVTPRDVGIVWGLILLAALVAAGLPLAFGIRRNPIRDMRDE